MGTLGGIGNGSRFFVSTAEAEITTLEELLGRYELDVLRTKKFHADVKSRIAIINRLIGFYSAAALTPEVLVAYRDERMTKVKGHTVRKELHLIGRKIGERQSFLRLRALEQRFYTALVGRKSLKPMRLKLAVERYSQRVKIDPLQLAAHPEAMSAVGE